MNPINPPDPPPEPELFTPRPPAPAAPGPLAEVDDLREETQDLRTLLHATLVALIVLVLGVSLYLFKQMRMARDQLNDYRAQMERAEAAFRKRDPEFRRIVTGLQQYAITHPDYAEILFKYRGTLPQYLPSPPSLSNKPDPGALVPAPLPNTR